MTQGVYKGGQSSVEMGYLNPLFLVILIYNVIKLRNILFSTFIVLQAQKI